MTSDQAAALLRTPRIEWTRPQAWCDLGCGEGLFTLALATLLVPTSSVFGIDRDQRALEKVPEEYRGVSIRRIRADLNSSSLRLPSVDGILMANVLHFFPKQEELLRRLQGLSKQFLIVEYERSRRSIWVPYPVNFQKLSDLFHATGEYFVERIDTRDSRFGGTMYSAFAKELKP